VNADTVEKKERRATWDYLVCKVKVACEGHRAQTETMVKSELRDHQVYRVNRDLKVSVVNMVTLVHRDSWDHLVCLGHLAIQVSVDRKETKERVNTKNLGDDSKVMALSMASLLKW